MLWNVSSIVFESGRSPISEIKVPSPHLFFFPLSSFSSFLFFLFHYLLFSSFSSFLFFSLLFLLFSSYLFLYLLTFSLLPFPFPEGVSPIMI